MEMAIGCDISKVRIDVVFLGAVEKRMQIKNEAAAVERFARHLPAASAVGMEATGTYHELLAEALAGAGHRVFVINARWIRHYARGLGARGKSDRGDAFVIARYVSAEQTRLRPYQPLTAEQRELRTLLQRRRAVARLAASARQSLGTAAPPLLEQLKLMLRGLERDISRLIQANAQWKELVERLRRLPGVGPLTAAQLVATFARLPFESVDAFVAHTGTDPRPNDSGQKQGRRRLSHHGDGSLRSLLYMSAMTAARHAEWKRFYEAQKHKGLPATAALIVVARKIARIAFSLYKSGQAYDPSRLTAAAGRA